MSQQPTIHSRRITRQMDHFIMALSTDPAHDRPDMLVSLYWMGYTVELGSVTSGHVAYVWGEHDVEDVLTDNVDLAVALGPKLRPGQWPLRDPDRQPRPATFERRMLQPYGFEYRVRSEGLDIDARWEDLDTPSFASGPTRLRDAWITTLLVEALRPTVSFNGRQQHGSSFSNPIWTPWFGDQRGSCVIGLGETIYEVDAEGSETA
jgi:hypothetical protein